MLRYLFGRWIFLVSLGNPLLCPNVHCEKSTLLLFRIIPARTCVLLNTGCEHSPQHRHVPCLLRRNDQAGGRDAAVSVGVENAPLQSEVHVWYPPLGVLCFLFHPRLNCAEHSVSTSTETGMDGANATSSIITWVIRTLEMLTLAEICSGLCLGQEYFPCLAARTVLWGPHSQPMIAGNGVKPKSCYHSHTHAAFLRQLKCGRQLEVVIVSWQKKRPIYIHTQN